jgi:DNA-binding NarL/FixJ family response regulator
MSNLPNAIRVLLVDDHPILLRGLRSLLSSSPDIQVVGEASNAPDALQHAVDLSPNVILLDIQLPGANGVELVYQLRNQVPGARIIVLTAYNHDEYVTGALRAGVHAYLLKSTSDEILIESVQAVYQGRHLISPSLVEKVLTEYQAVATEYSRIQSDFPEQELRVLILLAQGSTTKEISEETFWSERTVKRKIREIMIKLGAETRAQAVAERNVSMI